MIRYVLDTNVLSETARPEPNARVLTFLNGVTNAAISAVTLHELRFGAARVRDAARRAKLTKWVDDVAARFAARVIAIDAQIAEAAGALRAQSQLRGRPMEAMDALVAACAAETSAVLVTRNISDFAAIGISVFNPWD